MKYLLIEFSVYLVVFINDIYSHNTKYNQGRLNAPSAENGIFRDNSVGVFVDLIATSIVRFSAATPLTIYAKRYLAFYERGAISTLYTVSVSRNYADVKCK